MLIKSNPVGYVMAFFEIIQEKKRFQTTHKQVVELRQIIAVNRELIDFFETKNIDNIEKFKFIDEIFADYNRDLKIFLKVIIERNSANILDEILKQYLILSNRELNILYAKVFTAFPLNKLEMAKIKSKLEKMYKKNIELDNKINKNLISGYKIKIGSEIIEQNVNNDLNRLKNYILSEGEV